MKIHRAALIGAGAIGAYLIWSFDTVSDIVFTVVAEEARKTQLERDGIVINGEHYSLQVQQPEQAGQQDPIFIATKYGALDEAISMLPPLVGPDTLILSLLHGVDSEDRISHLVRGSGRRSCPGNPFGRRRFNFSRPVRIV